MGLPKTVGFFMVGFIFMVESIFQASPLEKQSQVLHYSKLLSDVCITVKRKVKKIPLKTSTYS